MQQQVQKPLYVLIAATAGAIVVPINTSMLSVGLAPIMSDFQVPVSSATWLILLYLVVITSLQPTAGKLGDRYGHRRVFLSALLLFGGVSLGAALAPTYPLLVLFRVLQGLTSAALGPNAAALIRLAYPLREQGKALGLYVGAFSTGLTVGPVLSGLLISSIGWRAIFWVNLPLVLFSAWLGFRTLPASEPAKSVPFDWQGTWLFTALVGLVVVAVNLWKGGGLPIPLWSIIPVVLLLLLLFYRAEERAADPVIRLGLFRLPGFGGANLAVFLTHSMLYVFLVAIPLYLQQGRGLSATASGLQMGLFSLMQVVSAPFAGRLSDMWGRRPMVVLGGVTFLLGSAALALQTPTTPLFLVIVALILAGMGTGLSDAPVQAAALSVCPPEDVGAGSGVWYSSRYLGNIAGALLAGLLLPGDLTAGAPALFWAVAGIAVLLSASAWSMPNRFEERVEV